MPQSRITTFPRQEKKEGRGTDKDKTNATYETAADAQTKNSCNRGTTVERSVEKKILGDGVG